MEEFLLSDYLSILRPFLRPELVPPQSVDSIFSVTRHLPGRMTGFWVLECRLKAGQYPVDFLCCISRNERAVLTGSKPGQKLPEMFWLNPVWHRLREFCTAWSTPNSDLEKNVANIWLEFDLDSPPDFVPLPSVFLGTNSIQGGRFAPGNDTWLFTSSLAQWLGHELPHLTKNALLKCILRLPRHAQIFQIGTFLARSLPAIRIVVRGLDLTQVPAYLQAVGYSAQLDEFRAFLDGISPIGSEIFLDLDIYEGIGEKIGIEVQTDRVRFFKMRDQFDRLMEFIVMNGLCTPEKRDAIQAYPGYIDSRSHTDVWPERLLREAPEARTNTISVILRDLSHLKFVYKPSAEIEAKIYLQVKHCWLSPLEAVQTSLAYSPQLSTF